MTRLEKASPSEPARQRQLPGGTGEEPIEAKAQDAEARLSFSRRACESFFRLWCEKDREHSSRHAFFFISLFAICAVTAFIGCAPTLIYGHDDFFLLENGWRVVCGLRPFLDFSSSWGPVTFLVTGLGLKLANASPNGIGYGNALFGLTVGLWVYRLGRDRLASTPRLLLGLYVVLLVCAPYALGDWPLLSSHAMAYNRYGYALLALVVVECFDAMPGPMRHSGEWLGGLSTGAIVALALFLKASYALVSLPLIGASLVFRRPSSSRLAGLTLGFAVVALGFIAYLGFDVPSIVKAFRIAAGARLITYSFHQPVWEIEAHPLPLLLILALALSASLLRREARSWRDELQLPVLGILLFLGDIVLLTTNHQIDAMPLLGIFALLVASQLTEYRDGSSSETARSDLPYHAALLLLCAILLVPQFVSDLAGLGSAALRKAHPASARSPVRFTEPRIASLILYDDDRADPNANGSVYTTYVNDGTALLRKHCDPTDRVLTMDMQNPFPYALGWQPARGGMASTSFNFTFSAQYRPSSNEYFADATTVMVPKRPAQNTKYLDGLYAIYSPALAERYRLVAETDWWRLYKRK
jgi:hypothetical protein